MEHSSTSNIVPDIRTRDLRQLAIAALSRRTEFLGAIPERLFAANIVSLVLAILMLVGVVGGYWFHSAEDRLLTGIDLIGQAPALATLPEFANNGAFSGTSRLALLVVMLAATAAIVSAASAVVIPMLRGRATMLLAGLGIAGMVAGLVYLAEQTAPPTLGRTLESGFWVSMVGAFGLVVGLCMRQHLTVPRTRFPILAAALALNGAAYLLMLSAEVQRSRLNESVAFEITALIGIAIYGALMGGYLTGYIFSRKGYNTWQGRALGAIIGAFGNLFLLIPVWRFVPYNEKVAYKRIKLDEIIWGAAFLSPWIIGFILLNVHPLIDSYRVALYNWRGIGEPTQFVGLRHIQTVIEDSFFWQAFRNTVVYTATLVPIQMALSLLLAFVLNRARMRFATFYRTIYFLPVVTSVSVVAVVMRLILGNFGSSLSALFGIDPPINPISSPQLALVSVIAFGLWHSFGVNLVYFLAALQTVPQELYDAAKVDGANWHQEIRHITLPGIRPIAVVIVFMAIIGSMNVFEQSFVLTRGGPYFASQVVSGYIYNYAFTSPGSMTVPNLGFASAAALFFSMIMLVLTAINYFVISRMRRQNA